MKKVLVLVLGLFMIACGSDPKKKTEETKQEETKQEEAKPTKEELAVMSYPEIPKFSKQVVMIREEIHAFADDIKIEEVGVVEGETPGTYNFLFYVGDDTNVEALSTYTLALMVYPEDAKVLPTSKEQKRGFMVKSTKCNIMREGKYPVIMFKDYPINFKKIKTAKAYLYTKDGILNPKKQKLIIKEVSL